MTDFLPGMPFNFPSSFTKKRISFTAALIMVLAWGTMTGIVLGSLIASIEAARIVAVSGAVVLGLLGLIAGARFEKIFSRMQQVFLRRPHRSRSKAFWGGILGAMAGGIVGALLGAMMVAIVGLVIGSLLGALASNLVRTKRRKIVLIFLGSMLGATVQAFLLDQEQALVGALYGGALGVGSALGALVGLKTLAYVFRGRIRRQ